MIICHSFVALRETTGDGNCLFRAISDQLVGTEDNHKRIRQECVDFLRKNSEEFKPFVEEDYDSFLRSIGTLGEFAGNEVRLISRGAILKKSASK